LSYESRSDGGLAPLERAAGLWGIIYGKNNEDCSCGTCEECQSQQDHDLRKRKAKLENSARFKEAAKVVAGLRSNRDIKLTLIRRVHQDALDSAILRYMAKEALPDYYAGILKSSHCLDRLVEGIFHKVCKIPPAQSLTEQIANLSSSLRLNEGRLTVYDRVTQVQRFIHHTIDVQLGTGAARAVPLAPMKNALSAARLHLSILDVIDHRPGYLCYIDGLSKAAIQLEYDEPRPSTAPWGKRSSPRWRVRHLRPLSYYFSKDRRALLHALDNLDEQATTDQFVNDAILLYADAS
jgi:hypothetical protein